MTLFGLGFLGGAVALWISRSHGGHRSSKEVGAAIFLVIAVLFLAGALWLFRRGVLGGRRVRGVSLEPERTEYRRGEPVSVRVQNAASVEHLEVGLVCTQFKDVKRQTVDQNGVSHDVRAIDRNDVVADWHPLAEGSPLQSFQFTIPADAPFSYEGAAVSWAYRISVREPVAMRSDPHIDVPIWVSP